MDRGQGRQDGTAQCTLHTSSTRDYGARTAQCSFTGPPEQNRADPGSSIRMSKGGMWSRGGGWEGEGEGGPEVRVEGETT